MARSLRLDFAFDVFCIRVIHLFSPLTSERPRAVAVLRSAQLVVLALARLLVLRCRQGKEGSGRISSYTSLTLHLGCRGFVFELRNPQTSMSYMGTTLALQDKVQNVRNTQTEVDGG